MEGHSYNASGQITATYNGGTGYDLISLAALSGVPIHLNRVVLTAIVTGNPQLPIQILRRTAADTGGTAVAVIEKDSPSSPSASTAVTTINTGSTGAAGTGCGFDAQEWQQFGPYIFDRRPLGPIIAQATWVGIYMPSPVSASVVMGYRVEWTEVK
jgi:hypothetical protein